MKLYTLDASAWLRLFLQDGPVCPILEEAAAEVQRGDASFLAPELILVEAAHALQRKRRAKLLKDQEIRELWGDMRRTPIDLLAVSDHIAAAIELSARHDLSVYDALYLAVAMRTGAILLTADVQLHKVAVRLGVA